MEIKEGIYKARKERNFYKGYKNDMLVFICRIKKPIPLKNIIKLIKKYDKI